MQPNKIPITELQKLAARYGANELILIARFPGPEPKNKTVVNVVTYGQTDEQAGFAAIGGRQLAAVIEAQSRSLQDALEVAARIRPKDVQGGNDG